MKIIVVWSDSNSHWFDGVNYLYSTHTTNHPHS